MTNTIRTLGLILTLLVGLMTACSEESPTITQMGIHLVFDSDVDRIPIALAQIDAIFNQAITDVQKRHPGVTANPKEVTVIFHQHSWIAKRAKTSNGIETNILVNGLSWADGDRVEVAIFDMKGATIWEAVLQWEFQNIVLIQNGYYNEAH